MERISLPIRTKFEKVEQINNEFTKCKCYIMALGKNRNGSHFSREAVEDALYSFKNIPVIAFLYEGEDGNMHVAGHEMTVVERNGDLQWHTKCIPYGTVPDGTFAFEEVIESNGEKATYLTGEVILWSGKYPEIMDAIYSDDVYYNQSMEIKPLATEEFAADPNYTDITKFSASALCLLGKSDDAEYNVTPCFPSSSVIPYSFDEQFVELLNEFKFALAECFTNKEDEGCEVKTMSKEMIMAVLEEYGLSEDQIDFEIADDMTEEALRQRIDEFVANGVAEVAEADDSEEVEPDDDSSVFSTTYAQRREILSGICRNMCNHDEETGDCESYWLVDFDDDYMYVNKESRVNEEWTCDVGRIPYSFNEDKTDAVITGDFVKMFVKWLTQEEMDALGRKEAEFNAYVENHSYENSEVEALRDFKENRLAQDHAEQANAILDKFTDLFENEEFKSLRENAASYQDLQVLEDKCYSIRGRAMQVQFSAKPAEETGTVPVFNMNPRESADELYGGLFSIYGTRK